MGTNRHLQITNFEYGSVTRNEGKVLVAINKAHYQTSNILGLEEILKEAQKGLSFLELEKITQDEAQVSLVYKDEAHLKMANKLHKETLPVRLSILESILYDDVLSKNNVSLHPATLFYFPMREVKYLYLSAGNMPYDNRNSNFEKYKALVLNVITGISFESCLNKTEELQKKKDNLTVDILKTTNLKELQHLISETNSYVNYEFINHSVKATQKEKMSVRKKIAIGCVVLLCGVTLLGLQSKKSKEALADQYEQKIEQQDTKIEIMKLAQKGSYKNIPTIMKKSGSSNKEIGETLYDYKQYKKALKYDPNLLEKVVQSLYDTDQKESIIDLDLPSSASKAQVDKLKTEKDLVNDDSNAVTNNLSFVSDKGTAGRMLDYYLAKGDQAHAQQILAKFNTKLNQAKYNLNQSTTDLENLKKELGELSKIDPKKDKAKDNKIKTKEQEITDKQAEVDKYTKQVDKYKKQ